MDVIDSDHALILRIAQKDSVAYRELVGKHLNRGVRVAERMLGNRQDAEDVMQNVCLKVWNEAERWKPQAKFSTWLYRVILNACIDEQRKIVPFSVVEMEEIADERLTTDERMIEEQRYRHVQTALQQLPGNQRAAVVFSYYEGLSNQESADAMEIQLGAFQQLLYRARQNLKELLIDDKRERKNG